ncbi:MAG: alpha/beta fold hydrolase [Chloracidobacterium sp.]|nr:alpha/beta fold hydrolase [Chloracidobacterium sp.]
MDAETHPEPLMRACFAVRRPWAARTLRVLVLLFAAAFVGYVGAGGYFYAVQHSMVFRAAAREGKARQKFPPPPGASYVEFQAERGETIMALFGPALDAHSEAVLPDAPRRPTLLFFYGVGEYLNYPFLRRQVEVFRRAGFNVFVPEYIGLGLSGGEPSEQGLYDTATAAFEHLKRRTDIDPQRIFIVGHSLGGAPAIDLAARVEAAGLVTLATFTTLSDIAALRYPMFPAQSLTRIRCPNIEKIGRVRCPVLILHAENDTTVPLWMAEALAKAAFEGGNRRVIQITLPGGNHDTTFALPDGDAVRAMQAFTGVASRSEENCKETVSLLRTDFR